MKIQIHCRNMIWINGWAFSFVIRDKKREYPVPVYKKYPSQLSRQIQYYINLGRIELVMIRPLNQPYTKSVR